MHLHCHIRQCVEDYGPVYNFWLFSYERYNGILEHFPCSNRSVELQLMQRFIKEFHVCTISIPEQFQDEVIHNPSLQGSIRSTFHPCALNLVNHQDWSLTNNIIDVELPKSYLLSTFDQNDIDKVRSLLACLFPTLPLDDLTINSAFRKY